MFCFKSLTFAKALQPQLARAEPALKRFKSSATRLLKTIGANAPLFLIVVKDTILEPKTDKIIISKNLKMDIDSYANFLSLVKDSTFEYYNIRLVLGLKYT